MARGVPRGESGAGKQELFKQGMRDASFKDAKEKEEEGTTEKREKEVEFAPEDLGASSQNDPDEVRRQLAQEEKIFEEELRAAHDWVERAAAKGPDAK